MRAAKRDSNEAEIIKALQAVGAAVKQNKEEDIPDLSVGFRKRNYYLEVKTEKGRLTRGQKMFHAWWPGHCAVVRTVDEALRAIGAVSCAE